LHILCVVPTN